MRNPEEIDIRLAQCEADILQTQREIAVLARKSEASPRSSRRRVNEHDRLSWELELRRIERDVLISVGSALHLYKLAIDNQLAELETAVLSDAPWGETGLEMIKLRVRQRIIRWIEEV